MITDAKLCVPPRSLASRYPRKSPGLFWGDNRGFVRGTARRGGGLSGDPGTTPKRDFKKQKLAPAATPESARGIPEISEQPKICSGAISGRARASVSSHFFNASVEEPNHARVPPMKEAPNPPTPQADSLIPSPKTQLCQLSPAADITKPEFPVLAPYSSQN